MTHLYETKYFGPGNVRGARIRVKRRDRNNYGKVTTTWHDYDHSARDAHDAALVEALVDDFGLDQYNLLTHADSETLDGTGTVRIVWQKPMSEDEKRALEFMRRCEGKPQSVAPDTLEIARKLVARGYLKDLGYGQFQYR